MTERRSYADPCGLARALDRVGERWSLLVVRELAFGPKRFSDLRRGLVGITAHLLTERLAELESAEVVQRVRLAPPVSATAYELTPLGHGLLPVLLSLVRWGSRLPATTTRELSPDAFWLALQAAYQPGHPDAGRIRIRLDDGAMEAQLDDQGLHWSPDLSTVPDAVIESTRSDLHRIVFGGADLVTALTGGGVRVTGDRDLVRRFVAACQAQR